MAVLVPVTRVLPHGAGTGSPVSSPVLCMVGTGIGTLPRFVLSQKQYFFSKTLRYAIMLGELYCVAKSFQNWSQLFLRTNRGNVPNFVLLKRTVPEC